MTLDVEPLSAGRLRKKVVEKMVSAMQRVHARAADDDEATVPEFISATVQLLQRQVLALDAVSAPEHRAANREALREAVAVVMLDLADPDGRH